MQGLYQLTRKDLPQAVTCLKNAFRDDPLWREVFRDDPNREQSLTSFYTIPLLYAMRYGGVYAPSPRIEGVAVLLPAKHAGMPTWGMLVSGALRHGARLGKGTLNNLAIVSKQLTTDRQRLMSGKAYQYLAGLGVDPDLQGQGYGSRLMEAITSNCDVSRLHIYLETETGDNVRFYQKHGLELLQRVEIPKFGLPMWQMAYEPKGGH